MMAATVVQQVCKSRRTCFKFYCMFYFTCDRSFSPAYKASWLRTPRLPGTKLTYRPLPHKCETHTTSVYPISDVPPLCSTAAYLPSTTCPRRLMRRHGIKVIVPKTACTFCREVLSVYTEWNVFVIVNAPGLLWPRHGYATQAILICCCR